MRTTLNTIYSNIQGNLDRITTSMSSINERISSGHQMSKISDNPVNLVSALRFRTTVAELDQFGDNITHGNSIITASESALTQMKDLALRAKTLAIQAANSDLNSDNLNAIAKEISQMFNQAVELGNTQINGQFIFGGQRTTGYTDIEPAPFIIDKGDGHWVNGTAASQGAISAAPLVTTDLGASDLLINGVGVGAITLSAGATNGLNMKGASSISGAINGNTYGGTKMSAKLTTLTTATAPTALATGAGTISFTLNGANINVSVANGDSAATTNAALVAAVNAVTDTTGVTAEIGDGTNGAAAKTLILKNTVTGDNTAITTSGFTNTATGTGIAIATATQTADSTHNTGVVSYSADSAFTITSSTTDDTILNRIGLGGGAKGDYDEPGDGTLVFGRPLISGDLKINGIDVPAPVADSMSDVYASSSAGAKATAINNIATQTGVTATVTEAHMAASAAVNAGTINAGDLTINGVDIFSGPTAVSSKDSTNTLITAINKQSAATGVEATRSLNGNLQLTAVDGRNIHIQTSTNGEDITRLNSGTGSLDQVYFGSLKLHSDRKFILQTVDPATNSTEPGLAAIGMAGGSSVTGETDDIAGDGRIDVFTIRAQTGAVRYTGDRQNDLNIKIGKTSTMKVGDNGKTGVADTSIFTTLKDLEDTLLGNNFTSVTGIHTATDTSQLLNSKETGLEPDSQLTSEDLFTDGSFTVTITDHDYDPPKTSPLTIGVDTTVDTLDSVTSRINGVPHISASWNSDGQLEINSDDPSRYTISLTNDSSNFLKATGVSSEFMQSQGIDQAMDNLDALMNSLTEQVSNFGARANRIDIQSQIYSEMTISTQENLSEVQDTDMIKAVMELKAKETAYQAALSAASKTMQLSLVDFL
jgi:flagellar hook-associated protein 3 FlgL